MNARIIVGVGLLVVGLLIFVFAPALMISDGREVILWANILPGIILVALGIALLATGARRKKKPLEFVRR